MKHTGWTTIAFLFLMVLVSGCMGVGPDYRRPEIGFTVPDAYLQTPDAAQKAGPNQGGAPKSLRTDPWWKAFGDPRINDLVQDTLAGNPDILKTAAVVLELEGRLVQARSSRFPALNLGGEGARSQATVSTTVPSVTPAGGLAFTPVSTRVTSNSFALSLPATFELDLWGRLARADEAARADLIAAEENRNTVVQSVLAETVSLYLELESLERRIALNTRRIDNLETGLRLVEKRYAAGLTGALEVRQARRSLSQAKSAQPSLTQALGIIQSRLSVLCGKYPETYPARFQPEEYYHRMTPVPVDLPSELLTRRPDIRAAEATLMAANARIGEAKAARFPSITLTGTFGYVSSELDSLVTPGTDLWEIAAGLFQPVFDAGRRRAAQEIAAARYLQYQSDWAKTVLNAFAEVEISLLTRRQQLERREELIGFLNEARATQQMAQVRYERGLVDYLTVLDAIIARFQAEEELILSDLTLMQNRVTLYRALGGGWPELYPGEELKASGIG